MQRRPTFLEVPGQNQACGVPTFLRCWRRQGERLAGLRAAVGPWSPAPGSAPLLRQSSGLGQSLCARGLRTVLWICSRLILGSGEDNQALVHL